MTRTSPAWTGRRWMGPWLVVAVFSSLHHCRFAQSADAPFAIQVVDEQTGRGVPLVELRTTTEQRFVTDSAGFAAIDEPELLGRKVFFHVRSHGYEFPADGFGSRGRAFDVRPGEQAVLMIRRNNIAERLYRVTGAGIYADSVALGRPVPLAQPLLSGGVVGQDSVQCCLHEDRVLWFWGDTSQLRYPLGQFRTSGAVSRLPSSGGLDPAIGVNLEYHVDENGFSRPMFDLQAPGVVWLDGLTSVPDAEGRQRIIGHYSRRKGLAEQLAHGIAEFDPLVARFESLAELPPEVTVHPLGQSAQRAAADAEYVYFANPYPSVRVLATYEAVIDPQQYEALTPLAPGTRFDGEQTSLERDDDGDVVYTWKHKTPPVTTAQEGALIAAGLLPAEQGRWQTVETGTGERVQLHAGSVRWNDYRKRWVMIAVQQYGQPSFLGEVWYAEASQPEGPWGKCVRILSHDRYSFYNPVHHEFFDQDGGRVIYFEGTYTHTFSGHPIPTPRYDYNQIMYRLDLADERLSPAQAE